MKKRQISSADLVVLCLLVEQPRHGYGLVVELYRRDVEDWAPISKPQVYYSINKLAKMKLIEVATDTGEALGPERDLYRVNTTGKRAIVEALNESDWATKRPPPPFLTWLALSIHLPTKAKKQMVQTRRDFLEKEIAREQNTLKEFDQESGVMATTGRLMVSLTIEHFQAELKWLKQVERELLKD